jgi:cytochrome P450
MELANQNTMDRRYNLLNIFLPELRAYLITPKDKRYGRNIACLRGVIRNIINDRKKGNTQSYNNDGSEDLLSILIKERFYNTDEKMIDELCTFFLAGMKTIQLTTANLIMYLTQNPEMKQRLLDETMPVVEAAR